MEYSYLIQEFVDGTLDKSSEENLFRELSSNEELRAELQQQIQIDKAYNKKLTAFVPSAKSTVDLFSKLGFVAPAAFVGGAAALSNAGRFGSFFSKYSQAFIGAGIAVFTSAAIFVTGWLSGFISFSDNNQKYANNLNENSAQYKSQNLTNNVPSIIKNEPSKSVNKTSDRASFSEYIKKESPASLAVINQKQEPTRDNSSSNIIEELDSDNQILNTKIADNIGYANIKTNAKSLNSYDINKLSSGYTMNNSSFSAQSVFSPDLQIYRELGVQMGFSGNQSWSLAQNPINESSYPKFNNMGLNFQYTLNDNLAIGLDFRQENFYQKFEGTDNFGNLYIYRQNPSYYSLALYGRYNLYKNEIFGNYLQLSAGMTQTGAVGRIGAGLELNASNRYSFLIGVEGSGLFYEHNNNWYYSPKFAVNYSILFKL